MPTYNQYLAQVEKDYPVVITGTINFLDKGVAIKSTVKTNDNKTYILSPNQPKAIYESFGVKNGVKVQIQGKIMQNNELSWITMKPI